MQKVTFANQQELEYLALIAKQFPSIEAVNTEIINLRAILALPKGTEHFMSDLHGEADAFFHILHSASGVVHTKIDELFGDILSEQQRDELATLIYYPRRKMQLLKPTIDDLGAWYERTFTQLFELARYVSTKYTRSKVRKALPTRFAYIIDELLHTDYATHNKDEYYRRVISTLLDLEAADDFLADISTLIKRLAVDHLHIVGDIFDRGPGPEDILDMLEGHHSLDIQWGNHDVLWMGAAAGSEACIANVLSIALKYGNVDTIENGYGISLRQLAAHADRVYDANPIYRPKVLSDRPIPAAFSDVGLISKMRKALQILMFKAEGQIIARHPEYEMQGRQLLEKVNYAGKSIEIAGKTYPMLDCVFPTVNPADPYTYTEEEAALMAGLVDSFVRSERLARHMHLLLTKGSLYRVYNGNLIFHGCMPLEADGTLSSMNINGTYFSGRALWDRCDQSIRRGLQLSERHPDKQGELDFMWYLWCGRNSPFFGKERMTTFERIFIEDKSTWKEPKNNYYKYIEREDYCEQMLEDFGLDPKHSHIINGHIPVKQKDGESPIKAGKRYINIDGGFSKAYQPDTGIAGYTLIYNSYGLRLVSHQPFDTTERAIRENLDIHSTTDIFELAPQRRLVADTDVGRELLGQIECLYRLLAAYRQGLLPEQAHPYSL